MDFRLRSTPEDVPNSALKLDLEATNEVTPEATLHLDLDASPSPTPDTSLNLDMDAQVLEGGDTTLKLDMDHIVVDEDGISMAILFNDGVCKCSGGVGNGAKVLWSDIEGKPTCILDCATLATYIKTQAPVIGIEDTPSIDLSLIDGVLSGTLTALVEAGDYGGANSSLIVRLNSEGRISYVEVVPIEITASQVIYSGMTLKQYLDSAPWDKHYHHDQTEAVAIWTIPHSLGKVPALTVKDKAGNTLAGYEVSTDNLNTTILTFSRAIDGDAWLN